MIKFVWEYRYSKHTHFVTGLTEMFVCVKYTAPERKLCGSPRGHEPSSSNHYRDWVGAEGGSSRVSMLCLPGCFEILGDLVQLR
jgi:hypothetical protein